MHVVVGGSRFQENYAFVSRILTAIHARTPITRLAHGNCRGTDLLCKQWAESRGVECVAYPADWDTYGRSAGPRRNAQMLESEAPDMVIAFPGGTGTNDLVTKATNARLPVTRVGLHKGEKLAPGATRGRKGL